MYLVMSKNPNFSKATIATEIAVHKFLKERKHLPVDLGGRGNHTIGTRIIEHHTQHI